MAKNVNDQIRTNRITNGTMQNSNGKLEQLDNKNKYQNVPVVVPETKNKMSVIKTKIKIRRRRRRDVKAATVGGGTTDNNGRLPSFKYRYRSRIDNNNDDDGDENSNDDVNGSNSSSIYNEEEDVPSDTMMVINTLIQDDHGLHLIPPIGTNNYNGTTVQAVLENQIYAKFGGSSSSIVNHASIVNAELHELIRTNTIRTIRCQGGGGVDGNNKNKYNTSTTSGSTTSIAYIPTEDYIQALWDAFNNNTDANTNNNNNNNNNVHGEKIVTWFISNLRYWTNDTISESNLLDAWENYNNNNNKVSDGRGNNNDNDNNEYTIQSTATNNHRNYYVIKYLLDSNFLIRETDNKHNFCRGYQEQQYFHFFLPQWGTYVSFVVVVDVYSCILVAHTKYCYGKGIK